MKFIISFNTLKKKLSVPVGQLEYWPINIELYVIKGYFMKGFKQSIWIETIFNISRQTNFFSVQASEERLFCFTHHFRNSVEVINNLNTINQSNSTFENMKKKWKS